MHPLAYVPLLPALAVILNCAPYVPPRSGAAQYTAKIAYCEEHFNGASLTRRAVVVFPALTRTGHDSAAYLSPQQQIEILKKVRNDLHYSTPDDFEKKYLSMHDSLSLSRFYQSLYKGKVVEAQTSDSVWKAMDASYMLFVRIRYAVAIRSFDGNSRRNLQMDAELWDVASGENLWRVEVTGIDKGLETNDARFLKGGLYEAFRKLPGFLPANNENNW
jgi:hypothetical protein